MGPQSEIKHPVYWCNRRNGRERISLLFKNTKNIITVSKQLEGKDFYKHDRRCIISNLTQASRQKCLLYSTVQTNKVYPQDECPYLCVIQPNRMCCQQVFPQKSNFFQVCNCTMFDFSSIHHMLSLIRYFCNMLASTK